MFISWSPGFLAAATAGSVRESPSPKQRAWSSCPVHRVWRLWSLQCRQQASKILGLWWKLKVETSRTALHFMVWICLCKRDLFRRSTAHCDLHLNDWLLHVVTPLCSGYIHLMFCFLHHKDTSKAFGFFKSKQLLEELDQSFREVQLWHMYVKWFIALGTACVQSICSIYQDWWTEEFSHD